ncbi:hypothetical protein TTHERM_00141180 (macronuclear) [Tetrahymena thermophila SB210]|uniref:Transmembrane protein n=1 Tax=Tetrahymena thermophila (strain SB210) TaxID=312017 RepID=I7MDR5_TETTS|nr:hypothetical protein TTHERM_00141180 [Tetrahymena thermophila SB210]EAR90810.2 hypothetical protein TTHERM_00141180 [Tetrahymena thermophila SB210]|eukprot:XP_001011055.2 hypothetical protein TTHERM_00141180 [Tetrahymena thermophila SB210]
MIKKSQILQIWITLLTVTNIICRQLVFEPNPILDFNLFNLKGQNTYLSVLSEDNQYAFISAREGGVYIISLANILQTTIVGNIAALQAQYLQVKKNILFIGDLLDGVVIYDISNITNPVLLSKWQLYLHIQALEITSDSNYLFALGNGIIFCIDISDPKNPKTISKNGIPSGESYRVRLSPDETHICVSNALAGIQIIDVRQKQQIIIRVNQNPAFVFWDCLFTPDQTSIYSVDAYYGLFYSNVQSVFSQPIGSTNVVPLNFVNLYLTPQVQQSIAITSDGLFLMLGQRSIGLVLFEIQNKNYQKPVFVQKLNGNYLSNDVYFSRNNNEAFAFVTNGMSLLIFKQVSINTNKDFPNVFNTFQSSLTYLSPEYFPWQIICLSNNKYIIQTNSHYGLNIFDIQDNYYPNLVKYIPIVKGDYGGVQVNEELNAMFVAGTQDGLITYNITDMTNINFVNNVTPIDPTLISNAVNGVTYNEKNKIIVVANGYYGFAVLNAVNPYSVSLIGLFLNDKYPCSFEKCQITNDTSTIICACREVGLFFFDFSNYKLQLTYLINKIGAEYLILSQDEKNAYVCFGFMGLVIVNIQNKMSPYIISIQPVDGWAQSLTAIFNEQYLIVTQIEKGQLVIVNIQDIQNPYIQSKLEFPNENSNSVCVTPDQKNAYFIGNRGLRYIPINTDLILHTQIQVQYTNTQGSIYYEDLSNSQSLLVGQTAKMYFVPLYIQTQVKISNAYYYRNYEVQLLPYWITFYQKTQSLQIQVDKTGAVNTFSNEKKGENIIILECLISLNADNFITQNINQVLSIQIYSNLISQGYLDSEGFLTSKLDSKIPFYLNFFDDKNFTQAKVGTQQQIQNIQNDIKQTLVFSLVQYSIRFFVQSSLFFNYNVQGNSTSNIISTPSLQISVLIQITSYGKFVKRQLDGVIASFSDDLTSLQISGQTQYVNQIIGQNLQIANSTSNLTKCILDFIIQDSSNYEISNKIPLSNLTFINLYSPIQLFQENNLQTQLNKQYSSGHLEVESRFQFSFDMTTFRQKDNLPITYTAFLIEGDQLTQITTGSWIEFNSFNLGFSGIKSITSLLQSYRIRIEATDSYSTTYDEFEFEFTQIPFLYVVQLIIQIVGPILGVFGIWKYRAEIYTFIMKKFYLYSSESAVVGEVYKKQIVLMNEIWEEAEKLWKFFLSVNKNFNNQILQEYQTHKALNTIEIMARVYKVYLDNQKRFINIDPREFEFIDSRLVRMVKRFCYQIILNKDQQTQKALQYLKRLGKKTNTDKDWYKQFAEIKYKFEVQKNKVVQKNPNENKTDLIVQSPLVLKHHSQKNQQSEIQNNSIESKRESQHASNVLDINSEHNALTDRKLIQNGCKDQSNEQTLNNIETKVQMPEFESYAFKDMNPINSNFQSQNKLNSPRLNFAIKSQDYIKEQEEQQKDKEEVLENLNPFPEIILKTELILEILKAKFPNQQNDMYLLQEILILEISGITLNSPNRISPAIGESLHLFSHQLLRVEAYKRDQEDSCCYCLKRFLKANYSPIGLNQNNPLPQWLNCQIINGIIHIWGTPKINDEPEILIKIVDQLTFTILSYHLMIKDKEGYDLRDKSNLSTINKIRSENNLVASLRMQKQKQLQQNQCQNPNEQKQDSFDPNSENKSKTLQLIPRLSKFSKDIPTFKNRNRGQSFQIENLRIQAVQEQPLKELDSPQKQKAGSQIDLQFQKDTNNFLNKLQSQLQNQQKHSQEKRFLKESSIEINMIDCSKEDKSLEDENNNQEEDEESQQQRNLDEKNVNYLVQIQKQNQSLLNRKMRFIIK